MMRFLVHPTPSLRLAAQGASLCGMLPALKELALMLVFRDGGTDQFTGSAQGASLADVVKQVVYVTDVRYQADVGRCRKEAYGDGPIPANTFLVINALAIPGMLLEIDVTAVVAK